eukprot:7112640-Prymnesium_polylepis.1
MAPKCRHAYLPRDAWFWETSRKGSSHLRRAPAAQGPEDLLLAAECDEQPQKANEAERPGAPQRLVLVKTGRTDPPLPGSPEPESSREFGL